MSSNTLHAAIGSLVLLGLLATLGCNNPVTATGPTEASARAKMKTELDNWMSGNESKAVTFDARLKAVDPPISYQIRSVVPSKPRIFWDMEARKEINDNTPAFRVVADVDFRSKADTPLTIVAEYILTWVPSRKSWVIEEPSH